MNKMKNFFYFFSVCMFASIYFAAAPLGMFVPYDINLRLKKPNVGNWQFNVLGEKSYQVQGYATNAAEDATFLVNPLQIYEPVQNIVSLYQGIDGSGSTIQSYATPFTALLDSIAGGSGSGVSNLQNGLYVPCADFSCGQVAFSVINALGHGFYIGAYLPVYFVSMSNMNWQYQGTNTLFAGAKIQKDLIDLFTQDAAQYFGLNVGSWKQNGLGDLTFLAEWQRDFVQRRPVLKSVQVNVRLGLSVPTAKKLDESLIMPVAFGSDGALNIPFGAGLALQLGPLFEFGFSGQFWCFLSNEKCRRIKTFPTQTSLLYPIITNTYKKNSILQNFNLFAQLYAPQKRVSTKIVYQHWRKPQEKLYTFDTQYNLDVVNSAPNLDEWTRHQIEIFGIYSPVRGDFARIIPQFELFWKGSFGGMRAMTASTVGAQFSLIF